MLHRDGSASDAPAGRGAPHVRVRTYALHMDNHDLWARVRSDYLECERRRPDGWIPVVAVTLAGRPEPMEVGFVTTSDSHDWIRFESAIRDAGEHAPGAIPAKCFWVHARDSAVLGVEIRFKQSGGTPFGFGHAVSGGDDDSEPELA